MAKKQKLLALLTAGTLAASMVPFNVLAAGSIEIGLATAPAEEDIVNDIAPVTVRYNAMGVDQVTIMVTAAGFDLGVNNQNVSYIDQQDGSMKEFTFNVDRKVLKELNSYDLSVKIGGTGIDSPVQAEALVSIPQQQQDAPVINVRDGIDLDTEVVAVELPADFDTNLVTSIKIGEIEVFGAGQWNSNAYELTDNSLLLADLNGAESKTYTITVNATGYKPAVLEDITFTSSKNAALKEIQAAFPGATVDEDGNYTAEAKKDSTIVMAVSNDELTQDTITIAAPEGATVTGVEASIPDSLAEVTPNESYTVTRDAENEIVVTVTFTYTTTAGDVTVKVNKTVPKAGAEEQTGPVIDAAKTKVYDVVAPFGLEGYKRMFIKLEDGNGAWNPTHSDAESIIAYSSEREGYDALIKTAATAVEDILAEIEWTEEAPTVAIAKYGDVNSDDKINAKDGAQIKKYVLGTAELSKLELMTLDCINDGKVNAKDGAQIKKFVLGTITDIEIATEK